MAWSWRHHTDRRGAGMFADVGGKTVRRHERGGAVACKAPADRAPYGRATASGGGLARARIRWFNRSDQDRVVPRASQPSVGGREVVALPLRLIGARLSAICGSRAGRCPTASSACGHAGSACLSSSISLRAVCARQRRRWAAHRCPVRERTPAGPRSGLTHGGGKRVAIARAVVGDPTLVPPTNRLGTPIRRPERP
jgi:hypothetical protein